jgi:hypothetical protein
MQTLSWLYVVEASTGMSSPFFKCKSLFKKSSNLGETRSPVHSENDLFVQVDEQEHRRHPLRRRVGRRRVGAAFLLPSFKTFFLLCH